MKKKVLFFIYFALILFTYSKDNVISIVKENNVPALQEALIRREDINEVDLQTGETPLFYAVRNGSNETLDILLENEANIEFTNKKDETALIVAVQNKNIYAIKQLLNKGASYKKKDKEGLTAFNYAIYSEDKSIIDLFYKVTNNVNIIDNKGDLPIEYYIKNKNVDMAKYILSKGAFVSEKGPSGLTPLMLSMENGLTELTDKILYTRPSLTVKSSDGKSLLYFALINGDLETANYLFKNGAKLYDLDNSKKSLLNQLIERTNNPIIFNFFKDKNINVNEVDIEGKSLLHNSLKYNNSTAFKFFVSLGADTNVRDKNGETPFHYAVKNKNMKEIMFLYSNNANLYVKDNLGKKPLDYADKEVLNLTNNIWYYLFWEGMDTNNFELIKKSISNGLDANTKNKEGKSALQISYERNHSNIFEYLVSNKAFDSEVFKTIVVEKDKDYFDIIKSNWVYTDSDYNKIMLLAIESRSNEIVKGLYEIKGTVDFFVEKDKTPLFVAIEKDNINLIKFFLEKTKDINMLDSNDENAIFKTIDKNNLEFTKLLVDKNININQKNKNGITPIFKTVIDDDYLEITKYLIEKGADITLKSKEGLNPVLLSAKNKAIRNLDFLLKNGGDINSTDNNGDTLLMYGVYFNNDKFIKYLLDKKININIKNKDGKTASDLADESFKLAIKDYWTYKMVEGIKLKDNQMVDEAYKNGANIKYIDIAGDTLLHIAISNKNNDVILPLINKGIDINIGNKNNLTPLHIAVINRDIDLIKLLLSKGAKTDIKDSKGKTAIDYALEKKDEELASLLLN